MLEEGGLSQEERGGTGEQTTPRITHYTYTRTHTHLTHHREEGHGREGMEGE